jgi:hypothetical protein
LAHHKQEVPMVAMKIWYRLSGFRGEDFLEIDQPETRMAYVFKCLICVNMLIFFFFYSAVDTM